MIDFQPEIIKLGSNLANIVGSNTVSVIMDKIKTSKAIDNKDQAIANLVEIINELNSEKSQLIQIAQGYEQQLVGQKISEDEVDYISEQIIPLINKLLSDSDKDESKTQDMINKMTQILSKETFNILQLLGFNFKQAIGEPLTVLVREYIFSQIPCNSELELEIKLAVEKKEYEYMKLINDEESYNRLLRIKGIIE